MIVTHCTPLFKICTFVHITNEFLKYDITSSPHPVLTPTLSLFSLYPQDYAKNITGKAVHGALLFLERGHFTADHLAHILKIPMSKNHARKHLATKLASLFTEDLSE